MTIPKNTAVKKSQPVERGIGLTIWLALLVFQSALGIVLILDLTNRPDDPSRPYLLAALFILSAAKLVGVLGIWLWKRWGLYTYAGSVVVIAIIGLMLTGTALMIFYELLPVAITGWLLREKLQHFQ
ncbi:MAG: hypothetical protein P8074_26530 [Anaerolineales bacterium]